MYYSSLQHHPKKSGGYLFIFKQDMTFNSHLKPTSRTAFFPFITLQKSGTSCLKKMQEN